MFSEDDKGICIDILGKRHKFSCDEDQANDLLKAADDLSTLCREIKQKNTMTSEQTLLVAAMNLSYSLMKANTTLEENVNKQSALIAKLKSALT